MNAFINFGSSPFVKRAKKKKNILKIMVTILQLIVVKFGVVGGLA
jgi:hypothetical protein